MLKTILQGLMNILGRTKGFSLVASALDKIKEYFTTKPNTMTQELALIENDNSNKDIKTELSELEEIKEAFKNAGKYRKKYPTLAIILARHYGLGRRDSDKKEIPLHLFDEKIEVEYKIGLEKYE